MLDVYHNKIEHCPDAKHGNADVLCIAHKPCGHMSYPDCDPDVHIDNLLLMHAHMECVYRLELEK